MSNTTLKHILYAEDEADIRDIAQIALEDIGGFSVTYCPNGRAVLEAAEELVPDLLLLDVMMPDMNGPDALRELRTKAGFIGVPAIFMTAKIQSEEMEEYKALGAIDVIPKPFDPMLLADNIKKSWNKHYGQ